LLNLDIRRPVVSAQILVKLASERGLSVDDCLRGTRIDKHALTDPQTEITVAQELRLIRNMLAALGPSPGLGLDVGQRYHLSSYGIWGYALLSSPTMRSALQIAVRYLELSYSFGRFRLENRGRDLLIVLSDDGFPEDIRQFLIERDFAAWANAARELRPGGFPARSAQFRFSRPNYAKGLEKLCGVPPVFDAALNAVLLDAESLDAPLPLADPVMARMCEEQCRQLLARRRIRTGTAGEVRDRLLRDPAAMPSLARVAEELHISARSLSRRLQSEGTSFRQLVEEVRQALAEELLALTHMKIAEVSSLIGYAEPAIFINAFKRWRSMSPTQYRNSKRNETPQGDRIRD
jgi:AraC-like DNA-binding protein